MPTSKIYLYTRFERFWHWLQAIIIFVLLITGFEIHGTYRLMGFDTAVRIHNMFGFGWVVLFALIIFWVFTTGEWRQYAANGMMKVYRSYRDGRRDGEEYIYSDEGKLEEINTYREGEKIRVKRYDDKGNLVEELDERAILRQLRR
ncbi:MAG: cytochrome b/b6 domain-containing protein [Candidatus Thermochlorobacter sp.]